jgi:hypothetical protein
MEPIKDREKVKKMFTQGQTTIVNTQTGYKYTMVTRCPKDKNYASIAQIERSGQALSRVIFQCPYCFSRFEANQDEICIR